MKHTIVTSILVAMLALLSCPAFYARQIVINRVEQMPNMPSPYIMRDWKQVARNYDAFVFDFDKTGDHLPLIWWDTTELNSPQTGFGLPAYVGSFVQNGGALHDSVNCIAAVVGASLCGIDKSDQNGYNWVEMLQNYFVSGTRQNVYLNTTYAVTGGSFWYEVLPNILFYQVRDLYPGTGNIGNQFSIVADRWYDACIALGGATDPWAIPNFDYTAFDFMTMTGKNNGWLEADSAAGIAWLEYMAYVDSGDPKYLDGADWAIQSLEVKTINPLHDMMICFAPYVSARMNAELGRSYDTKKYIDWCFEGNQYDQWGIRANTWGGIPIHGLVSNSNYAFELESVIFASTIAPAVRYDQRYAQAVGKYMLNLANSLRMFYPDSLPETHQTSFAWADTYDPGNCIAYEGLRSERVDHNRTSAENTMTGNLISGDHTATQTRYSDYEVLEEETLPGGEDGLEHVWEITLTEGYRYQIVVWAYKTDGGDADGGFKFSYADDRAGPYIDLFTVNSEGVEAVYWTLLSGVSGDIFLRANDDNRSAGESMHDKLHVNEIYVVTNNNSIAPYLMGDPTGFGWAATDLGLYGSSYVGYIGGMVSTTNVEKILQVDLLATDFYHDTAYPTYLYYNPYSDSKEVSIDVGTAPVDLYDTVSQTFLVTDARGDTSFAIPGNSSVVAVLAPAGGEVTYFDRKMLIDNVIVDYNVMPQSFIGEPFPPDVETALLLHLDGDLVDSSPNNYLCQFSSISGHGNPFYSSSLDKFGECLYGEGGNINGIQIADTDISVQHPSPLTIEAWLNIPGSHAAQDFTDCILDLAAGRLIFYVRFLANGTAQPQLVIWNGEFFERNECTITSADEWYYDEWHHFSVTYDSHREDSPVSFYFDGLEMPIEPSGGDPSITSEYEKVPMYGLAAGRPWVPNEPTQIFNPLIGYIDEIRLSTKIRYPVQTQSGMSGWNLY